METDRGVLDAQLRASWYDTPGWISERMNRAASPDGVNRDKTGVARSVMANWVGQVVTVVSGFVLPRILNDSLGQAELGVWDFGWTARSVISTSALGMGSCSNHYAARFRASGEWDRLNRTLSATLALVIYTSWLALLITVGLAMCTHFLMPTETLELIFSARGVGADASTADDLETIL